MMFKKWKPFWSYDIEKTEEWLSEMAQKGYQLCAINRITRMFSFEKTEQEELSYHISYEKNQQTLPTTLTNTGWKEHITEGNWRILENNEPNTGLIPSRDGLVKRNRLHSLILTIISIYYGMQLVLPLSIILIMITSSGESIEFTVESSPLWSLTLLYFLQVIGVMIVAVTMTRKLRAFERHYYDMETDAEVFVGKTFAKWKPNWMVTPDITEKWLEDMALKGNHLVKVQATRFLFEKGRAKRIAYALDFQWKASPAYAEIHKSAGWKFMYTTSHSFCKTAIWAKEYTLNDEKPRLTYDLDERKGQKKKVFISQGGFMLLMLLFLGYILRNLLSVSQYIDWTPYRYFLVIALIAIIIIYLYNFIRMTRYALKADE